MSTRLTVTDSKEDSRFVRLTLAPALTEVASVLPSRPSPRRHWDYLAAEASGKGGVQLKSCFADTKMLNDALLEGQLLGRETFLKVLSKADVYRTKRHAAEMRGIEQPAALAWSQETGELVRTMNRAAEAAMDYNADPSLSTEHAAMEKVLAAVRAGERYVGMVANNAQRKVG